MEITEVVYPKNRKEWRKWLETHHKTKTEAWVRTFLKASGKPCCTYEEIVEECLCFGWIDGSVKKYDAESKVQRVTPRRKKSSLSELNRQRVWKLQEQGKMTAAGLAAIEGQIGSPDDQLEIPEWILKQLKADTEAWKHFQAFPKPYQRLKIKWIADINYKTRQAEAQKRLDYLIKMSRQGKRYGAEPIQ